MSLSPQGNSPLLSLDIYYLQAFPKGSCSAYRVFKTVLLERQEASVDLPPAASAAAATGTVCKIEIWQGGDSRDRVWKTYIVPIKKKHTPSPDPFGELIEHMECTCIADVIFTLARLFALLALMLFAKNVYTETSLWAHHMECSCQGGSCRVRQQGHIKGCPAPMEAYPSDLHQSDILGNVMT